MTKKKTMKKLILIALLVPLAGNCFSQALNWIWAKQETSTLLPYRESYFSEIVLEASGYIYAVGHNNDTTISFGTTTLTHRGMFLVKYDTSGNVIWAKDASGNGTFNYDSFTITVDESGNIYVAGHFYGSTVTFGTITLSNQGLFIVKYDSNGNVLWAKDALGNAEVYSIKSDFFGNIFAVGGFRGGSLILGTTTLMNANNSSFADDIFIAKYDSTGNVIWAKSAGGTHHDVVQSVSIDLSGNLYLAGVYGSTTISFDTITLTNSSSPAPEYDMFLAKYNSAGNAIWVKTAIGTRSDGAQTVTVDINNNIVVAGNFTSPSITFDNVTLTKDTTLFYSGAIFIVKYNASGNVIWASNSLGKGSDGVSSITTDSVANIYIAGGSSQDTITLSQTVIAYGGLYIAKYDINGTPIWAQGMGKGPDVINSLTLDASNHIYIAGGFWNDSLTFGSTILLNPNGFVGGPERVFIAKSHDFITTNLHEIKNYQPIITISPNPFSTQTSIFFNESQKNTSIKIIDMLGKEIKTLSVTGKQIEIEKGEMRPGIYFLQIFSDQNNGVNKKIIIQ